ncbi:MAG: TIR domain-containing protein [Sedimentisphaerales bacterium]
MKDFFISYNNTDKKYAQRIADWLDRAHFTTILQANNFVAGSNFVSEIHTALEQARRIILVLSPDYLTAPFPEAEWMAAFAKNPTNEDRTLIPVRVCECEPDGLLRPIVYIDLVGLSVKKAKTKFLAEMQATLEGKRVSKMRSDVGSVPKSKSPQDRISVVGNGNVTAGRDIHVAGNLNIKIPKGKKFSRPIIIPGTVGEDARMYGYLNYLVERYNRFKEWDCKEAKLKMDYSLIRVAYKREIKYNIKDTPRDMFDRAVEYLQKRISSTKLGRIEKSRGQEIFSSFETFDQNEAVKGALGRWAIRTSQANQQESDLNLTKEEIKYLIAIADQEGRIYSNLLSAFTGRDTEIYREMLNKFVQTGLMREELDYWALTAKGYEVCENLRQENNPKSNNLQFEQRSGTFISKTSSFRYCPKCYHSTPSKKVELQESQSGWKCSVCDSFFPNPDWNPPPLNPYHRSPMSM